MMTSELEIIAGHSSLRVCLEDDRMTVGKGPQNDVALDDATVSHMHATLEHFSAGWCITDLGSSNGTWINGERIWSRQPLRDGDEIRVGHTQLIFRDPDARHPRTETEEAPPNVTTRERDVLVSLCRPVLARDMFTEPASTRAIATELTISDAAVKQHLTNLFNKFGIAPDDEQRRLRLANDAIRRGVVTIADLQPPQTP